jgi:predicted transcriptional regulator
MDELFEKMYVIEKIEKGLEQVRNGETVSEEDLDEEIESWFK